MLLRCFLSLAILTIALSGTAAIAAPEPLANNSYKLQLAQRPEAGVGDRGNRQGRKGDRWIEQLNLTADQQQQIAQIRQESQGEFEQLHENMRQSRDRMRELMTSNASDGDLRNQHRQMQELRQRMSNLRFEQMLKIRGILTEAQRRELSTQMQERWQDPDNFGGRGRGRGRGGVNNDEF